MRWRAVRPLTSAPLGPMKRSSMEMPIDPGGSLPQQTAVIERRQRRVELPVCPTCQQPLRVDVRSSDTLYARCVSCGHRRMVAKPDPGHSERPRQEAATDPIAPHEPLA
jgi:DNA-directed RNA polymerase subunit RPC12/RpoP